MTFERRKKQRKKEGEEKEWRGIAAHKKKNVTEECHKSSSSKTVTKTQLTVSDEHFHVNDLTKRVPTSWFGYAPNVYDKENPD